MSRVTKVTLAVVAVVVIVAGFMIVTEWLARSSESQFNAQLQALTSLRETIEVELQELDNRWQQNQDQLQLVSDALDRDLSREQSRILENAFQNHLNQLKEVLIDAPARDQPERPNTFSSQLGSFDGFTVACHHVGFFETRRRYFYTCNNRLYPSPPSQFLEIRDSCDQRVIQVPPCSGFARDGGLLDQENAITHRVLYRHEYGITEELATLRGNDFLWFADYGNEAFRAPERNLPGPPDFLTLPRWSDNPQGEISFLNYRNVNPSIPPQPVPIAVNVKEAALGRAQDGNGEIPAGETLAPIPLGDRVSAQDFIDFVQWNSVSTLAANTRVNPNQNAAQQLQPPVVPRIVPLRLQGSFS